MPLPTQIGESGIALFNQSRFFEAHEALEDVWRAAPASEKKFWQGLIQAAVGFHHYSVGNRIGAQSLLARADRNLRAYPEEFRGIQLQLLLESLAEWQKALAPGSGKINLSLPFIQFSDTAGCD
jgi:predicted metal-dependent hydrolase